MFTVPAHESGAVVLGAAIHKIRCVKMFEDPMRGQLLNLTGYGLHLPRSTWHALPGPCPAHAYQAALFSVQREASALASNNHHRGCTNRGAHPKNPVVKTSGSTKRLKYIQRLQECGKKK